MAMIAKKVKEMTNDQNEEQARFRFKEELGNGVSERHAH